MPKNILGQNHVVNGDAKVQFFWEGHKKLRSRPHRFDIYHQNHEDDCANFCGLLRKAELYFIGVAFKVGYQGVMSFGWMWLDLLIRSVRRTYLINIFSLLQLETKTTFYKQCWQDIGYHLQFILGNFSYVKTCKARAEIS